MSDTPEQLRARLTALKDARDKLLNGERVQKVAYDGGSVEYAAPPSLADIQREIAACEIALARATGQGGRGMRYLRTFPA